MELISNIIVLIFCFYCGYCGVTTITRKVKGVIKTISGVKKDAKSTIVTTDASSTDAETP